MRRLLLVVVAALLPGLGASRARELAVIDLAEGETIRQPGYACPSPAHKLQRLYAVDAAGRIVRWALDALGLEPTIVVAPAEGEPPYRAALAQADGELVAGIRVWDVKRGAQVVYRRVALEVFDAAGQRLAGPLPLYRTTGLFNLALAAAWQPGAERLALWITEGNPKPGLYVFEPRTRNWTLAPDTAPPAEPLPVLRWQPSGRTLSYVTGTELVLRGGGSYAIFRAWERTERLHAWLDDETLGLLDPTRGIVRFNLAGQSRGVLPGWGGASLGVSSLPVAAPAGLAWVAPTPEAATLGLWLLEPGRREATCRLTFSAPQGELYGRSYAPPSWLGGRRLALELPDSPPPGG